LFKLLWPARGQVTEWKKEGHVFAGNWHGPTRPRARRRRTTAVLTEPETARERDVTEGGREGGIVGAGESGEVVAIIV
jgi:hypothetical protein